jgi:hypothetical protein
MQRLERCNSDAKPFCGERRIEKSANPVAMTDYIGKQVGLLQGMLSALGHGVSGLAFRAVRHVWSVSIFRHLQTRLFGSHVAYPSCVTQEHSRFLLRT